jgi:hypothetical protein
VAHLSGSLIFIDCRMHFVWFFLTLSLTGFLFLKIEPLVIAPTFLLLLRTANRHLPNPNESWSPLTWFVGIANLLVTTYAILGWCVFAVCVTRVFAYDLFVRSAWLYWVTGFFGCLAPIG